MPVDLSKINFQPLVDLLGKAGTETSEYQHAKSTGVMAQIAFWVGLAGMVAATVAQTFGADSKVGMIAAIAVTVTGVAAKVLSSNSYAASRADTKAAAGDVASAIVAASK